MANIEAKAVLKTVRIAPRKTRLVIDLIRGKNVADARAILANQPQRAARVIEKVLNSSVANAVNNFNLNEYFGKITLILESGGDGNVNDRVIGIG